MSTDIPTAYDPAVRAILGDNLSDTLGAVFDQMEWAEDELAAAQRRHPESAGQIWNSFALLRGTADLTGSEAIYRAHAREILERVHAEQDTRPATAAEIASACSKLSLEGHPLDDALQLVYARTFSQIFPAQAQEIWGETLGQLEQRAGAQADEVMARLRKAGHQDWRVGGES